jgi:hypothetical protein
MTASFAERIEQYVALRRGLGYRLARQATYLRSFAAFLDRCGHDGPVPLALSVQWATATRSHDPPIPPGDCRPLAGSWAISRRWTGRARSRRRGCSAPAITARHRTSTPIRRSKACSPPRLSCLLVAAYARSAT